MSSKDFKRGVSAAIKANTDFMHKQAEATAELGKRIVQKIDEQGQIIDVILDTLNEQEKKELYDLQSEYDIASLGQNEKEVLASFLLTLISKHNQDNDEQKDYYFAVKKHLKVTNVSDDLNLAVVENVDSRSELKAMFQTVCEFLFLKNGDTSFLNEFENELEYFGLTSKTIKEIIFSIEKVYNLLGLRGIVEHYILAEAEPAPINEEIHLVLDWEADRDFCLQNGIEIDFSKQIVISDNSPKNIIYKNFPTLRSSYRDSISFENCKFENCKNVSICAPIIRNCVFEKCEYVDIDDYYGEIGSIHIIDCVFDNINYICLHKVNVSQSYFKNIKYDKGADLNFEEAISLDNSTITTSVFEDIALIDDLFLFNALGFCEVRESKFINIFTERADMLISNYEEKIGIGFLKYTSQGVLVDKASCSGLDMINVIKM